MTNKKKKYLYYLTSRTSVLIKILCVKNSMVCVPLLSFFFLRTSSPFSTCSIFLTSFPFLSGVYFFYFNGDKKQFARCNRETLQLLCKKLPNWPTLKKSKLQLRWVWKFSLEIYGILYKKKQKKCVCCLVKTWKQYTSKKTRKQRWKRKPFQC